MRVYVFGIHQGALVQAMQEGIEKHGHRVVLRAQSAYRDNNYETCDAAVVFGLHRPGDLILAEHGARKTPVFVVDYGYVKRGTLMHSKVDENLYYSVSLNGLNGKSDPFPSPMSGERWEQLGVPLQPWRTSGKYILVCGQKQNDVSLGNLNPIFWAKQTIAKLQQITKRSIVFRPHPEDPAQRRPIGIPHDEHKTLADALVDAYALVAYNSNSLVEAVINGVVPFTLGDGSMVEGVTNTDLSLIDTPQTFDREQWASDLAWRQYTIGEIRSGLWWEYAVEKTIPLREIKPAMDFQSQSAIPQRLGEEKERTSNQMAEGGNEKFAPKEILPEGAIPIASILTRDDDGVGREIETEQFILNEIRYEDKEELTRLDATTTLLPEEEIETREVDFEKNVSPITSVSPFAKRGRPRKDSASSQV